MMLQQIETGSEIAKQASKAIIETGIIGSFLIIALLIIGLLVWSHNKKNQLLQDKVDKVIAQHIETIKESSKDSQIMLDKYHSFVNEIKDLFHNHHK